jgi:SAM-dependent methyltransferase
VTTMAWSASVAIMVVAFRRRLPSTIRHRRDRRGSTGARLAPTAGTIRSTVVPTRLNIGCGPALAPGWLNADKQPYAGLDACGDLCAGLPLPAASIDAIVAMHVLQDLAWGELPAALAEIRRLLKPGGALRLGLPDLDRAMDAYRRGDGAYFFVPDSDARSLGAKLVTQIIWYGSVRTPFTFDFAHELLQRAGFRAIVRCRYHESRHGDAMLVELDNRERESFFVEALK